MRFLIALLFCGIAHADDRWQLAVTGKGWFILDSTNGAVTYCVDRPTYPITISCFPSGANGSGPIGTFEIKPIGPFQAVVLNKKSGESFYCMWSGGGSTCTQAK